MTCGNISIQNKISGDRGCNILILREENFLIISMNIENFIKGNWFKLGILLILLITGLFYFSSLSQKGNVNNVSFNNKEKCAGQAQVFLQHEKQIDSPENGINASVLNEQYVYNSSLNTCLVYFEVVEVGAGTTYNIIDLLTNKKIYTYVEYRDSSTQRFWNESCKVSDGCFTNKDDFMVKFNELFR